MTYVVKDIFRTIQGEGSHAGEPAIFVRFAGCNMWSGDDEDRVRDAKRNDAECPRWCDTDFRAGGAMRVNAEQIAATVARMRHNFAPSLVVITGGEPLLQLDQALLDALRDNEDAPMVAVETNGTVRPKFAIVDAWITMSPKVPRAHIALRPEEVDELKLVWPAYDPEEWKDWPGVKFISPQARSTERDLGNEKRAAQWVNVNGDWRLSLQMHKLVDLP